MDPTYAQAIKDIESSGGNYGAIGPATRSGDQAYGAYQVMGSNVPDWTDKHFGQRLTPQEFLKNKEAQDAVFNGQFGGYVNKYGNPQDAASAWFSGRPMTHNTSSDGHMSVPSYVDAFNKALGVKNAGGTGALSFANEDGEDNADTGQLSTNNVVGPGALTSRRVMNGDNGDNSANVIGQGLTGIGAALAGISSPSQAQTLNQQVAAMKKDNQSKYKISVTKDGQIVRVDDQGNVDTVGGTPKTGDGTPPMLGDQTKSGDEYLKTLQPVDQAIVSDWLEGKGVMPSAYQMKNAHTMQLIAAAHQADPDFDIGKLKGRMTMQTDLAKTSPATLGGILANGASAFRHLGLASDGFVGVGNSNGYDGPGGNIVAQGINAVKNYGGSSKIADKLNAANEEISKYGTESTKYYAGSPGGVHERAAAQKATDPWTASAGAQAGYVDASKNLMIERGKELENHIRDTMGQRYLDKHPVFSDETHKLIDRIDQNVGKLRGPTSTTSPASDKRPPLNQLIPLN